MKIGDIVKDKKTGQLGIIVNKYPGPNFDWEVFAIKKPFSYGFVWQDCFKEEQLEEYEWKDFPKGFWSSLLHLIRGIL